jgi:ribosome recycling factor
MAVRFELHEKLDAKMGKKISVFKEDLNSVKAVRANPALLDKIMVEYYGSPTPLKQLANISVPDPRTLAIQPFDPKTVAGIEKAINLANLGINPTNDGKIIRLAIPVVTEERRKELTKQVKKMAEAAKVAIRNERRDANDALKKEEKAGEMTEDDLKDAIDEVQKMIDKNVAEIEKIAAHKEKEIMEV